MCCHPNQFNFRTFTSLKSENATIWQGTSSISNRNYFAISLEVDKSMQIIDIVEKREDKLPVLMFRISRYVKAAVLQELLNANDRWSSRILLPRV